MAGNNKAVEELPYDLFREILDKSYDEIFITNAAGKVIYVNAICEKHYGLKASEMTGKTSNEMTEKNLWGPRLSPMALKLKTSLTLEQKTCTGKTLLSTATPFFDKNGEVIYIMENSRDISDVDGLKYELKKTQELITKFSLDTDHKQELIIPDFVAQSKEMKDVVRYAWHIAPVNSNVLILGESGTGKSILAKYIHSQSPRKNGPFVTINCASIPSSLMESELFGYSKGAFTGANTGGKAGLIDLADGGTLFLDEIAEIPISLQAKLLQVLQENTYYEVGGRKIKQANCRIIAATNQDLKKMIREGTFREDLYYRLSVFEIVIPPLSQRTDDVVKLIYYFLNLLNNKYHTNHQITQKCQNYLSNYNWPGNVRELENTIERLVVMVPDIEIDVPHLPKHIKKISTPINRQQKELDLSTSDLIPLKDALEAIEKKLVQKAFKELKTSYRVAEALKISQSTANRLKNRYCKKAK